MKVIKDSQGKVIHIGEWDQENIPDGCYEDDEPVSTLPDGSRVTPLDYRKSRRLAYPSIADQLDYIYHFGIEAWKKDIVKPVKDKYPKV